MKAILFFIAWLLAAGSTAANQPNQVTQSSSFSKSIQVEGLDRTYVVQLPPNYKQEQALPLIVALHGGGGSGKRFEQLTQLTETAHAQQYIVVYANGYSGIGGKRTWNAGNCCGGAQSKRIDDVLFISKLIDTVIAEYKANPKRVYLVGHSNGGMLAYRLANELANKLAGIAVNSCSMVLSTPLQPARPVPILHLHSQADTRVPLLGNVGSRGRYYPPVDSVLNAWATVNACNPSPHTSKHPGYSHTQWLSCAGGADIELYVSADGGHSWPGAVRTNPNADPPSSAINANQLLLDFFNRHQLP